MNTKNKIVLTLIISLFIVGAGGYYFYSLYSKGPMIFEDSYGMYYGPKNEKSVVMLDTLGQSTAKKSTDKKSVEKNSSQTSYSTNTD